MPVVKFVCARERSENFDLQGAIKWDYPSILRITRFWRVLSGRLPYNTLKKSVIWKAGR
jgi:coenzyme F420-reducing hydrogenase delta subunit